MAGAALPEPNRPAKGLDGAGASFLGAGAAAGVGAAGAEALLGLALPNFSGTVDLGAAAAGGGVGFLAGAGAPPNRPVKGLEGAGASFLGAGATGAGAAAGLGAGGRMVGEGDLGVSDRPERQESEWNPRRPSRRSAPRRTGLGRAAELKGWDARLGRGSLRDGGRRGRRRGRGLLGRRRRATEEAREGVGRRGGGGWLGLGRRRRGGRGRGLGRCLGW